MMNATFPEPGNTTTAHTLEKEQIEKEHAPGNYYKEFATRSLFEKSRYTQSDWSVGLAGFSEIFDTAAS
jgi:hypothetical protein